MVRTIAVLALAALVSTANAQAPSIVDTDMAAFCASARQTAELSSIYPGALGRGRSGQAVVDCSIAETGRLSSCRIAEERPARRGFAESALKVACRVAVPMSGGQVDTAAMPGDSGVYADQEGRSRLRLTVRFNGRGGLVGP
ncbi:MAG: TonB family protein [Hyphomonadaceae bacterium]|nr:TonB family protein [Hyphomonadaceae bacterium]